MAIGDLYGVIVGGAIGLAGSILPRIWEQRRARASARAVARAYVSGILGMEAVRQHGTLYRHNLEQIRSGATQELLRVFGAEDYSGDEMQKALIGQLGLLKPEDASDLVQFCNMLAGLRIDLKAMALHQMDQLTPEQKIGILERDLKLWDDTLKLGRALVARL